MKIISTILILLLPLLSFSQEVTGKWRTIDDVTGKAKSIIKIYEENGKIYGQIEKILTPGKENNLCTECKGENKDKPIKGMIILKDLEKDGEEWNDGSILDPNTGKIYSCYINLESNKKLKVRGYIGFSLLGRTQYWHKVEE